MSARAKVHIVLLIVALATALVATGCPKKPAETPPAEPTPTPVEKPIERVEVPREPIAEPMPAEAPVQVEPLDEMIRDQNEARAYLKTVYFDFDEYALREDTVAALKQNALWLKAHSGFKVVVEGHCDERGTIEYNLELGAKRAHAVVDYLGSLGVDVSKLRTISYGEERPVDPGHDEAAWGLNRRADFTLEK